MNLKAKEISFFVIVALLLTSTIVLGQDTAKIIHESTTTSIMQDVDMLIKIIVAIITGLATIFGIPIIFLTYRKTRAEITKLELEANSIRIQQASISHPQVMDDAGVHILLNKSPHSKIQVLADPRFLAPLLILLDFMFAWIVLSIYSRLLSIFNFGLLGTLTLVLLSFLLLLPIARQILRVRTVLKPPRTSEEINALKRQYQIAAYSLYVVVLVLSLFTGILLLNLSGLTNLGRYIAWFLILCGVLILLSWPLLKRKLDQFILNLYSNDNDKIKKNIQLSVD